MQFSIPRGKSKQTLEALVHCKELNCYCLRGKSSSSQHFKPTTPTVWRGNGCLPRTLRCWRGESHNYRRVLLVFTYKGMKTREGAVKELPVFFVFLTQQEPQSSKCHSLNVTSLWMMQVFVSLISAAPIRFGFTSVSFCSPKTCMLTGGVSVRAVGVTIPSCKQFNVFTQTHEISSERPGYLLLSTSWLIKLAQISKKI